MYIFRESIRRYAINYKCYRLSVISVTVTKGGPSGSGGLYKTSGTMGRGVAKSCSQFST